ncbi:MAG: cytochrome c biogenesis protein CcdA [Candidatus Acididesulfobacter diazotrophicus]|jgi:cytochrome c-type biogenesis protein|uniref:Cytochrome c biogenesis protein CcdA n=1 Tax=Candidatus Acididesulfobacter diazotrophicus TaxID=2597226 RepID=A0A519BQ87_9DELT|nr:MAG: cytochrome c biogenesis protein CcdA [Candidatus Acididesulfobacter diazotrophicus]
MFNLNITYSVALFGGMLAFFSPCVLPLIPGYISFISGVNIETLTSEKNHKNLIRVFTASLAFVIGFSVIFVGLGIGSETIFSNFLKSNLNIVRIVGGIVIILFGLYCLGLFKLNFLSREVNILPWKKKGGFIIGSFILGIAFAAGWIPCIGPILASILLYTSMNGSLTKSIELLSFFSLGLGIPFILAGLFLTYFMTFFKKIKRHLNLFSIVSGGFLILMGILTITGNFEALSQYLIGVL